MRPITRGKRFPIRRQGARSCGRSEQGSRNDDRAQSPGGGAYRDGCRLVYRHIRRIAKPEMNALISRLISDATAPVEQMSARLFKKAVLFLVAIGCLFVCSIFLTIALFIFVQPLVGTAIAAVGTGSLYLGVAGICIVVASRGRAEQVTPAAAESGPMTETREILQPKSLRLRAIMTRPSRLYSIFCAKPASSANASLLRPAWRSQNNCIRFRWSPWRLPQALSLAAS